MIILKTLWDIVLSIFIVILVMDILYGICETLDWIEYKIFEKRVNEYYEYLEQKDYKESLERYDYDLHLQYMMREWNW